MFTAQNMKFSIKDFFSKRDQIPSFLQIWSHLLKKSLMENFIFCAVVSISQEVIILLWNYFITLVNTHLNHANWTLIILSNSRWPTIICFKHYMSIISKLMPSYYPTCFLLLLLLLLNCCFKYWFLEKPRMKEQMRIQRPVRYLSFFWENSLRFSAIN